MHIYVGLDNASLYNILEANETRSKRLSTFKCFRLKLHFICTLNTFSHTIVV